MGRQHTIYLSDATWNQLETLMRMNETMSATIRRCIQASYDNIKQFDRIKNLEKLIAKLCEDDDQ